MPEDIREKCLELVEQCHDEKILNFLNNLLDDYFDKRNKEVALILKNDRSLAGKAKGYDFSSTLDGRQIEWKFVVDRSGRVWIESVKFTDAKTSSFGNYSEIIDTGFLTSKPFEYREQAAGIPGRDNVELTPDVAANAPQNMDHQYQYVDQTPILSALAPIQAFKAALPYLK